MRRWFRPVAYTIILALAAMAVFGRAPEPERVEAVIRPPPAPERVAAPERVPASKPRLVARVDDAFAPDLFVAPPPPPPPPPVEAATPVVQAPADLKILGWMQSADGPCVFVELGGKHYTLSPTQAAEETYRFDKIGGGFAEFTYLPTGQSRQYAVSDPALVE